MDVRQSALYAAISSTAHAFVESYNLCSKHRDLSLLSSNLTDDCTRSFGPKSWFHTLPGLAREFSNQEYEEAVRLQMLGKFDSIARVIDATIDEVQRKAVVHTEFHNVEKTGEEGRTVTQSQERIYIVEFVFTLFMTDDGTQVRKVVQFIDTTGVRAIMDAETDVRDQLEEHCS